MYRISVYVVDDHDIVLTGMQAILQSSPDITLVGSATDGVQALRDIRRLRPQVVLLDLQLPGLPGLEILRQIQEDQIPTRVLVYSMYSDISYVAEALRYGATSYLTKGAPSGEIVEAIYQTAVGRRYLWPHYDDKQIELYQRRAARSNRSYAELSRREREVLTLTAQGETSQAIAAQLGISVRTVENHRYRLMKKLNLRSIADLIRFAISNRLIDE